MQFWVDAALPQRKRVLVPSDPGSGKALIVLFLRLKNALSTNQSSSSPTSPQLSVFCFLRFLNSTLYTSCLLEGSNAFTMLSWEPHTSEGYHLWVAWVPCELSQLIKLGSTDPFLPHSVELTALCSFGLTLLYPKGNVCWFHLIKALIALFL